MPSVVIYRIDGGKESLYDLTTVTSSSYNDKDTIKGLFINCQNVGPTSFSGAANLESVVFGKKTKLIEYDAFNNCQKLNKVIFGENIIKIGDRCFKNCGLQTVNLRNIIDFGGNCFQGTKLTFDVFTVKKDMSFRYGGGWPSCFYDTKINKLVLDEGVEVMKESGYAFGDFNVTNIYLPHSLKRLNMWDLRAFDRKGKIYYNGTLEEWQNVYRADAVVGWGTPNVVCKDGIGTTGKNII